MDDLLDAAGGATEPLQALLVGGYFGTWVEASARGPLAPGARGPPIGGLLARLRAC